MPNADPNAFADSKGYLALCVVFLSHLENYECIRRLVRPSHSLLEHLSKSCGGLLTDTETSLIAINVCWSK